MTSCRLSKAAIQMRLGRRRGSFSAIHLEVNPAIGSIHGQSTLDAYSTAVANY
jgi:hypothetical protein